MFLKGSWWCGANSVSAAAQGSIASRTTMDRSGFFFKKKHKYKTIINVCRGLFSGLLWLFTWWISWKKNWVQGFFFCVLLFVFFVICVFFYSFAPPFFFLFLLCFFLFADSLLLVCVFCVVFLFHFLFFFYFINSNSATPQMHFHAVSASFLTSSGYLLRYVITAAARSAWEASESRFSFRWWTYFKKNKLHKLTALGDREKCELLQNKCGVNNWEYMSLQDMLCLCEVNCIFMGLFFPCFSDRFFPVFCVHTACF